MRCERCDGLMVTDHYIDMDGGGSWLKAWRCMCCGNVVDNQIKAHHSIDNPLAYRQRSSRKFQEDRRLQPAIWL
jgi:hypothetical protein